MAIDPTALRPGRRPSAAARETARATRRAPRPEARAEPPPVPCGDALGSSSFLSLGQRRPRRRSVTQAG